MSGNAGIIPRSLRIVATAVTVTAATLMLQAHQTALYLDAPVVDVTFGDLAPYWCFVFANYVLAAYSFLLAFLPSESKLWGFIVALDAILLVIFSSSCSAALAVGIMERNGNFHAGWNSMYPSVPYYCFRVLLSVSVGFVGVVIYMILHLISIQAALNSMLL
ncbi:CASP-like protein 1C1 [Gastrolobium bilobum]|uniref:CASP-like protein 1C1 n=1 Tax=Gastrolobium bilobum TaxID=150636 RepID=UPI002AAFB40D|nr:CASP-like protein 1C1 [Gastrolobium bilobum]